MNFVKHSNLEGLHAIFSPSQSSWLRYDDDKALEVYSSKQAAQIGSRIHAWAKETIDLGIKQPRSPKTIYAYVNDAIGFKMSTEVVLFYSERFFGTADSISFKNGFLRIHDLKTGKIPADMEGCDVGRKSAELYAEAGKAAKTVIWNGPMGVFENPTLAAGTLAVAKAMAESEAVTIIGGGDSAAAVEQMGLGDKMTHISTGGGASLEYLEGKTLPGVACLDEK